MKKIILYFLILSILILPGYFFIKTFFLKTKTKAYNLLLITLDTTRADRIGCYGYSKAITPALDNLAKIGFQFNAICNVPLTFPSHSTIMTGLYPSEHNCQTNGSHKLSDNIKTLAEIFSDYGYKTAAFPAAFVLDKKFGLHQGFEFYDSYKKNDDKTNFYSDHLMYSYRRGNVVADSAIKWLQNNSSNPFFCWVHFFDPHKPHFPNKHLSNYKDLHPYDKEIAFMDSQINRLITFLRKNQLLKKTIIIVVGDHGEGLGDHKEEEHGLFLYNSTMKVPLITFVPQANINERRTKNLIATIDIFPTVLDLFNFKYTGHISGKSFASLFYKNTTFSNDIFLDTLFPQTEFGWSPLKAVISNKWKYIQAPKEELFNLTKDPNELNNLINKEDLMANKMRIKLKAMENKMIKEKAFSIKLDESDKRNLASLGYIGGGSLKPKHSGTLRDPKDAIDLKNEFNMALIKSKQGYQKEAEKIMRGLIKKSPESYIFNYKLAEILFKQDRFPEALSEFKKIVLLTPNDFRAHFNLGKCLSKMQLHSEAINEFQLAIKIDPSETSAYNKLGISFLKNKQKEKAVQAFKQSLAIDFHQFDPHNNLGHAYLLLNKFTEAKEEFQIAISINPEAYESHYNLGLTLLKLGETANAALEFQTVLKLKPTFTPAKKKLGLALIKSKYPDA